jgi:hypothetical protein
MIIKPSVEIRSYLLMDDTRATTATPGHVDCGPHCRQNEHCCCSDCHSVKLEIRIVT